MNQELEKRIQALEDRFKLLESTTTIPREIDTAFRDRFGISDYAKLTSSTKDIATETQAVNESGSGSYSVPKMFDGFREFTTDAVTLYIPYYELT